MRKIRWVGAVLVVFLFLLITGGVWADEVNSKKFQAVLKEGVYGILSYDNDIVEPNPIFVPIFIVDANGKLIDPYLKGARFMNNAYRNNKWKIINGRTIFGKLYNVIFKSYSLQQEEIKKELYNSLKRNVADRIEGHGKIYWLKNFKNSLGVVFIVPINSEAIFERPITVKEEALPREVFSNVLTFLKKEMMNLKTKDLELFLIDELHLYNFRLNDKKGIIFCYGGRLRQCYVRWENKLIQKISEREPIDIDGYIYLVGYVDLDNDGINELVFEEAFHISDDLNLFTYKIYKYDPSMKLFRLVYKTKYIPEWGP